HFYHLTSSFFGLTPEYKRPLLEEIWICTKYMKGVNYSDVLEMPTYERRYFLGLLTKQASEREEQNEEIKNNTKSSGKGN
ncbi:hypothetical protein ABK046_51185, partial [Streptomyces caeruleatus]